MSEVIVCLMGPTASGKTALAIEIMQHVASEIVSVDSTLVYQGMDIGTAKPDAALLARAPHHLIDCCTPDASYSAAQFYADATRVISEIRGRNHLPLLVGGTMMYFRALQQGLAVLPRADPTIRADLDRHIKQHGLVATHAWLAQVDPLSAQRIHPQDSQRLQRALEVYLLTQKPLSAQLEALPAKPPWRFINLALFPERRAWLHQRIEERLQGMLVQGFLAETAELVQRWQLTAAHPSMKSVGYRQALAYLQGECDYAQFYAQALAATRQLAKRQLTWLRSWPVIQHFDPEDRECSQQVVATVQQIMHNGTPTDN